MFKTESANCLSAGSIVYIILLECLVAQTASSLNARNAAWRRTAQVLQDVNVHVF